MKKPSERIEEINNERYEKHCNECFSHYYECSLSPIDFIPNSTLQYLDEQFLQDKKEEKIPYICKVEGCEKLGCKGCLSSLAREFTGTEDNRCTCGGYKDKNGICKFCSAFI